MAKVKRRAARYVDDDEEDDGRVRGGGDDESSSSSSTSSDEGSKQSSSAGSSDDGSDVEEGAPDDLEAMGYGDDAGEEPEKSDEDDDDDDDDDDDGSSSEDDDESSESGEDVEDGDDEDRSDEPPTLPQVDAAAGEERCTLDLRNLTAVNSHQVSVEAMYASNHAKNRNDGGDADERVTISPKPDAIPAYFAVANESHLFEEAREGCTQLLRGLWSLETERTDVGAMAVLPAKVEIATPRELPPPPPKKETKWEKFAKERGIPTNKEKRSRKVWDDATQTWMYRHGYQKANDASSRGWPIMEVKGNEDPYEDPWERERDAKRTRVEKNEVNRMRNMERAGMLPRGTATRTLKGAKKAREVGRAAGAGAGGIPIDLAKGNKRGKERTQSALLATQRSTASLGRFDKMREGEPERKKTIGTGGLKKRKFESATDAKVVRSEADRNVRLLDNVMKGGGVEKVKAIRRGDLAKGETAYDYDYNDGLGSSSFRKKKGRAGAGKMRKVTKKRAK